MLKLQGIFQEWRRQSALALLSMAAQDCSKAATRAGMSGAAVLNEARLVPHRFKPESLSPDQIVSFMTEGGSFALVKDARVCGENFAQVFGSFSRVAAGSSLEYIIGADGNFHREAHKIVEALLRAANGRSMSLSGLEMFFHYRQSLAQAWLAAAPKLSVTEAPAQLKYRGIPYLRNNVELLSTLAHQAERYASGLAALVQQLKAVEVSGAEGAEASVSVPGGSECEREIQDLIFAVKSIMASREESVSFQILYGLGFVCEKANGFAKLEMEPGDLSEQDVQTILASRQILFEALQKTFEAAIFAYQAKIAKTKELIAAAGLLEQALNRRATA
ncbi:MAG: hypothetical protein HY986_13515 [Candidatus Melainabacteria bacterium]|nr:hypothetical protein [Candidatus Melainabacteria bacterium]